MTKHKTPGLSKSHILQVWALVANQTVNGLTLNSVKLIRTQTCPATNMTMFQFGYRLRLDNCFVA